MTEEQKIQALHTFSIFKQVHKKDLPRIASYLEAKIIPAHKTFIKEGASDDAMYFIVSGFVRIYHLHENGKEMTVTMRLPGEIIGEMPLMDGGPRSASAETIEETQLLVIQRDKFLFLMQKYPTICFNYLKILSQRLREAIHAQKIASFENLEDRTYHILQILSPHFAHKGVTLSHEQLSVLVNATQPRVTEALHELKRNNKISLFRKKILIN